MHDKQYLLSNYNISKDKINVLYNYVDADLFFPMGVEKYEKKVVFVGHLSKVMRCLKQSLH